MFELPLFPLHTVLFPNTPITLHIFEDRYKKMFTRLIEKQELFGVVLIQRGREAFGPLAEPHPIGCTARITMAQRLDDGRMNIVAVGGERFRIINLNRALEHLVGDVELLPLEYEKPGDLLLPQKELRPWVRRYLNILADASLVRGNIERLPTDPLEFAYLAAFLLQVNSGQKQSLLEVDRGTQLIADINSLYRREVALLKKLLLVEKLNDDQKIWMN